MHTPWVGRLRIQAGFVTREPDEQQLAVGRAAMEEILRAERSVGVAA